jgi:hypothetical protein
LWWGPGLSFTAGVNSKWCSTEEVNLMSQYMPSATIIKTKNKNMEQGSIK